MSEPVGLVRAMLGRCAALLVPALTAASSCAASEPPPTLLIEAAAGAPPRGWRHEQRLDGAAHNGPGLVVAYHYGANAGSDRTLEVDIANPSDQVGHYVLFIGDDGRARPVTPGASYQLSARVQSLAGDVPVNLGFHLWDAQCERLSGSAVFWL